jgi:hypothetical protein
MQRDLTPLPRSGSPAGRRVRTVWISDLHLGTPGCRADALLHFLNHVELVAVRVPSGRLAPAAS